MDWLCRIRNKIICVLSWRTVSALTWVLCWCLFPSLLRNSGNKHQNNPLVSAETVRHSSTFIILYMWSPRHPPPLPQPQAFLTHNYAHHWKCLVAMSRHYSDVIMSTIASLITSITIVYLTVYSDEDQRKHQSPASLAFVRGIHRRPVNSPHKWPVTREMFPFDDVITDMFTGIFCLVNVEQYGVNECAVNKYIIFYSIYTDLY